MPHAQDREELGHCLPTFPPTFRRGRHRARRSRAAGLRDAHPAPAANQETPVGFRTEQITNVYRVHEPTRGLACSQWPCLLLGLTLGQLASANFHPKRARTILSVCAGVSDPEILLRGYDESQTKAPRLAARRRVFRCRFCKRSASTHRQREQRLREINERRPFRTAVLEP
jgi:hypothetical protein